MKRLAAVMAAGLLATSVSAGDVVTYTSTDSFDDVSFSLESAIVDKGLVIDWVSHTGEMLERTRGDVGSDVVLFTAAHVYQFCSAALSRKVMEADLMNIQFCPYGIFVAQKAGEDTVMVGYRTFPDGPMKEVEALLDELARAAAGQ